jgi:hypothetical protein
MGSKPVTAVETEAKSIRLELSTDNHQLFRVEAAKKGSSLAAVARRQLEEYVKRKGIAN